MTKIQQGDQYTIPITITQGGTTITPNECDDVCVAIGPYQLSYSADELSWNSTDEVWELPLTEEMSRSLLSTKTEIQVGVKIGADRVLSVVQNVTVNPSIISEDW